MQTVEARIDTDGSIMLLDPITLPAVRRALVVILDEPPRMEHADASLSGDLAVVPLSPDVEGLSPNENEAWTQPQQIP